MASRNFCELPRDDHGFILAEDTAQTLELALATLYKRIDLVHRSATTTTTRIIRIASFGPNNVARTRFPRSARSTGIEDERD